MNIIIRNECEADYKRVEEIARDAFWNLYVPGAEEHYVVHKMRSHPDFIKELTFVVEVDGKVEGAIFYSKSKVVRTDGKEVDTISFGPVFIAPEWHRKGLGYKLISHSINVARELGYNAILTLGYSYHYAPFGFLGGKIYGISMPDGKYYKGLLVLPLKKKEIDWDGGYVVFSDVYDVEKEEVDQFDQQFTFKEKHYQPSQDEYALASSLTEE